MTRRGLLAMPALVRGTAAQAPKIATAQTISFITGTYAGWPTVARRRDGQLLLVYSGGREAHVCPFGRVELMRSKDEGATWSWPEVLMDTAIDDRDAGICETASGSLLVTTFTSLAYEAQLEKYGASWPVEKRARWEAVQRRTSPQERKNLLGNWMLRSTDGGMTWSAPYRVPLNSPHGPVAVSKGRILYAGRPLWSNDNRIGVAESTDDGVTWRWLAEVPVRRGDSADQYHELHLVEASRDRLIVHIRNQNPVNDRETLQSESTDGGRTWSEPHPIGVWGMPSHLLRLGDGRLVMTYGYRRAPFGNEARVSTDGGRTWGEPIKVSMDGSSGDLGYPSSVELAPGQLYTVWYERPANSPLALLRGVRWSLA